MDAADARFRFGYDRWAGRSPGQMDTIDCAEDIAAGRLPDPLARG